jgi:hypothetical protein
MASRGEELFKQLRTVQAIRALTGQTEDVHLDCKEWPAKDEDAQNFAKHIRRRSWRLLDELREFEVNPNISENDPDIQAVWLSSHAPGQTSSSRRVFSGPSGSCRKLTSDSRQLSNSSLFFRCRWPRHSIEWHLRLGPCPLRFLPRRHAVRPLRGPSDPS